MKASVWIVLVVVLGCSQDSRSGVELSPAPCGPKGLKKSMYQPLLVGAIRTIRATRRADSIVMAKFTDVSVDSSAILAWYRVIDSEKTVDTVDYGFFVISFRGIPLYRGDTEAEVTSDSLKARLQRYYALTYLRKDRSGMFTTFYRGEYDYDQNLHALAFDTAPPLVEVYQLLEHWASPHTPRGVDSSRIVTGFVQPTVGERIMISSHSIAPTPRDLRPAMVIDGGVCVDAWRTYFGSEPVVRSADEQHREHQ